MCKVDFFDHKYICEEYRADVHFGLCDDGKLAYSDIFNRELWITSVFNNEAKKVLFTPVDHNIVVRKRNEDKDLKQPFKWERLSDD